MKRAIVAAVILVAGFAAWRYYDHSYAPASRYKAFAELIAHRQFDAAAAMCDGLSPTDLQKQEQIDPAMLQTLFPSRFSIDSTDVADGVLTLHAVQTMLFNPPGVESVRPAMYARFDQVVKMRNGRVVAFENKFEKMDSLSSR